MPQDSSVVHGTSATLFPLTHWSVILAAGDVAAPENEAALARFCQAYWYPLYVFARGSGHPREEAQDLAQEFFARLLDKNLLAGVTRDGGKFRSYLLTVFKNFVANEWNRQCAQKRGGGKPVISIDDTAEVRYLHELADHTTPESLYDRQWALTVQDQVHARLQEEYRASGKQEVFAALQGCLPGAHRDLSHADAAKTLGLTDEAVRVAIHRLRRRYGELLRQEIATAGTKREDIDEEIRYLMSVLLGH